VAVAAEVTDSLYCLRSTVHSHCDKTGDCGLKTEDRLSVS